MLINTLGLKSAIALSAVAFGLATGPVHAQSRSTPPGMTPNWTATPHQKIAQAAAKVSR